MGTQEPGTTPDPTQQQAEQAWEQGQPDVVDAAQAVPDQPDTLPETPPTTAEQIQRQADIEAQDYNQTIADAAAQAQSASVSAEAQGSEIVQPAYSDPIGQAATHFEDTLAAPPADPRPAAVSPAQMAQLQTVVRANADRLHQALTGLEDSIGEKIAAAVTAQTTDWQVPAKMLPAPTADYTPTAEEQARADKRSAVEDAKLAAMERILGQIAGAGSDQDLIALTEAYKNLASSGIW